jgi:hypothetical protein
MGIMLRKLENATFFLAMLLAVVLEAGIVYWISKHPASPPASFSLAGEWTGIALPQGWLFGALLVLAYRLTEISIEPLNCAQSEARHNRQAFLRLWRWTIALIGMQGLVLFVGRSVAS